MIVHVEIVKFLKTRLMKQHPVSETVLDWVYKCHSRHYNTSFTSKCSHNAFCIAYFVFNTNIPQEILMVIMHYNIKITNNVFSLNMPYTYSHNMTCKKGILMSKSEKKICTQSPHTMYCRSCIVWVWRRLTHRAHQRAPETTRAADQHCFILQSTLNAGSSILTSDPTHRFATRGLRTNKNTSLDIFNVNLYK